jgi:hypothetical protein
VQQYRRHEQLGGEKMSLLLHVPAPVEKLVVKSKHGEPTTSSILLISVALFLAFVLLTSIGLIFPNTMNQYNTCRDKIVGYEQSGMYASAEQFKLALSYCGTS